MKLYKQKALGRSLLLCALLTYTLQPYMTTSKLNGFRSITLATIRFNHAFIFIYSTATFEIIK